MDDKQTTEPMSISAAVSVLAAAIHASHRRGQAVAGTAAPTRPEPPAAHPVSQPTPAWTPHPTAPVSSASAEQSGGHFPYGPDPLSPFPFTSETRAHVLSEPVPAAAKPVEAGEKPVDPAQLLAAEPAPFPTGLAAIQPPMGLQSSTVDPVLAGFDRAVALAGYVLLFASVFMLGVPALAALALAYVHKGDTHPLVRGHFRFQIRIFWTALVFLVLAVVLFLTATGFGVGWLAGMAEAHLPGFSQVVTPVNAGVWSGQVAGVLLITALALAVLMVIWTLAASLFGFLRLASDKPVGHSGV